MDEQYTETPRTTTGAAAPAKATAATSITIRCKNAFHFAQSDAAFWVSMTKEPR